jgi:hypothetical protein
MEMWVTCAPLTLGWAHCLPQGDPFSSLGPGFSGLCLPLSQSPQPRSAQSACCLSTIVAEGGDSDEVDCLGPGEGLQG